MLKIACTAVVTAAITVTVVATTGLAATKPKVIYMKVHNIVALKSDNFQCQAITKIEVACGANTLPNSVQTYYAPHEIAVVKFNNTGKAANVLLHVKR